MKRLLAALCVLLQTGQAGAADGLILSGHPYFPPFMYEHGQKIAGICPELVERILSELKLPVQNRFAGPWARALLNAKTGEVDVIACVYKTEERMAFMEFVPTPVIANEAVVFVKKGHAFPFAHWDDLKGKTAGAVISDKFEQAFEDFLDKNQESIPVQRVTSVDQNFKKLLLDRLDFIPYSKYAGTLVLEKNGIRDQVEILRTPIFTGQLYVAISKKSPWLKYLPDIDKKIVEFKKTRIIDDLVNKHIAGYAQESKADFAPPH
ncbi:MAG: transporter substrate-binding domain-containing protein [Pseudomonadota bacterium]